MGCSGIRIKNEINALEAFKSLKKLKLKIQKENFNQYNIYLITAKSIPKFIEKIENSDTKKNIPENSSEDYYDKYLNDLFKNYEKEQFEFLNNFVECWHLIGKSLEENQFIIVDESFMNNMDMDIENDIIKKKVAIEVKAENNFRSIVFIYFKGKIAFDEIDNKMLYKFVGSDDNKLLMVYNNENEKKEDKFNPRREVVKTEENENVQSNGNQKSIQKREKDSKNNIINPSYIFTFII